MEVRIRIIDTLEDTHVYTLEKAEGGSIIVDWKGSDRKDDLNIVGSTLAVTMARLSREDGAYYDLFTGDETRYRVIMDLADGSYTIWQGFLLPDSYSEPYSNSPILVDVVASDGLGRLKGKFLPEDFYEEEKSVIAILSECLKLTGVGLDLRFAPAIENTQQKDYNQIYLDTRDYLSDDGKKDDAYSILSELLESMLCTVYQADNYYNIEGLNIREQRVYNSKIYDADGVFIEEQEITRLQKDITGTGRPEITMQPPYGIVRVEHEKTDISIPETTSEEQNDGWSLARGTFHFIYATDWYSLSGDFFAKAAQYSFDVYNPTRPERDDLQVYFERGTDVQAITLRNRPYIEKGKKYKLVLNFELLTYIELSQITKETFINEGFWTNPFTLQISNRHENEDGLIAIDVIYANYGLLSDSPRYIEQAFGEDQVVENELYFIANHSGLLNIQIGAVEDVLNQIEYVAINDASIETVDFEENYVAEINLEDEYTSKKEVELDIADSATGFSRGFRLHKLRAEEDYNLLQVEITRVFQRDGYYYGVTSLAGANLVAENLDTYEVIYNYNNSEEHVLRRDSEITPGVFTIRVYNYNSVTENRDYWTQWTDSLYKVEKIPYPDAYANILNRLFDRPVPSMPNFRLKNNVKFNDFITFDWRNNRQWIITNCKWDVDKGFTDVSAVANYYAVEPQTNIPPIVEAGNDIQIETETQFQLTSEAFDPDGFIASYNWTEITSTGATITAPNSQNTNVTGFTADFATFEVTVTDNEGSTASDTVDVFRVQDHNFIVEKTFQGTNNSNYDVYLDPDIASGASVNIQGEIRVSLNRSTGSTQNLSAFAQIYINGDLIKNKVINVGGNPEPMQPMSIIEGFSLNYFRGDDIEIRLSAIATTPDSAFAGVFFDTVEFVEGLGTINNQEQSAVEN